MGSMGGENRADPRASRLRMPGGHQQAAEGDPLLPWAEAVARLERAQNYWLARTGPDGRPHVTPLWGVWVAGAFWFDGIPMAWWAQNLAANPAISVNLESGGDIVILEGDAEDIEAVTDADLAARIVAAWGQKYGGELPRLTERGLFRLRPRSARGWTWFPHDATRWNFGLSDERPPPRRCAPTRSQPWERVRENAIRSQDWERVVGGEGRSSYSTSNNVAGGCVVAPSDACVTRAAYFARTPVV
jgi:hypothetical protein